ncbi:NAD-dependent epimerase/dehydratase family protein [Sporosarcina sp. BI001-red]|uniref:NAD(P)-dependent oxidoreductase n=1 Tax=Sporosarcina sp. BI001-red TaxID=2282866 RepID=UPI000E27AAB1|nr:NAD(P)H-binding protein [Sporosarcina sp. BI001-red]REB07995.1 NAD-dependent epimerase/dehydratase family protein [Sporosarcina sp. BI001-red]
MRISLFGGTGRVGSLLLQRLLDGGHRVTALARNPEMLPIHPNLTVIQGDAKEQPAIATTILGSEAVVSALGTDKTTTLSDAIPHIIEAMRDENIKRILTIGTAGILQSRIDTKQLRYEAGDSNRKLTTAAEEHHAAYRALSDSNLDWTIVCPTYLPDGETTGIYRTEDNWLPLDGKQISTGDTAHFAELELFDCNHLHARVGIAY